MSVYDSVKTGAVSGAILGVGILAKEQKEGMSKWKDPLIQAGASTVSSMANGYIPSSMVPNAGVNLLVSSALTGVIYTLGHHLLEGKKGYLAPFVLSTTVDLAARGIVPKF